MRQLTLRGVAVVAVLGMQTLGISGAAERPWVPADSVGMRFIASNFEQPQSTYHTVIHGSAVGWSPDEQYILFVDWRGRLESDSNIYTLRVYRVEDLREWFARVRGRTAAPLEPYRAVALETKSSSLPAMHNVRWSADSKTVAFLGPDADGSDRLQVYQLDVLSGAVEAVTAHPHKIIEFASEVGCVLFRDEVRQEPAAWRYPLEAIERGPYGWILPASRTGLNPMRRVYVTCEKEAPRPVNGREIGADWIWPSLDGTYAVVLSPTGPKEYLLLDLKTGHVRSLLGAPVTKPFFSAPGSNRLITPAVGALWWPGRASRLILLGVQVPQSTGMSPASSNEGQGYVVEYEIESGQWKIIGPMVSGTGSGQRYVKEAVWLHPGRELRVRYEAVSDGRPLGEVRYRKDASGGWTALPVEGAEPQSLTVQLRQGMNDPPRVTVSDGRRELPLTAPDPALHGVRRARTETFQWQAPDKVMSGGLTLPFGHQAGEPVPLVIQAYHYLPEFFLPDGPILGVDAAQTYAARGIAVLQMPIDSVGIRFEGATLVGRIDAAISALAERGLIDPTRVGLVGFSRAGYQTYYAITHPGRWPLAAAACVDSFTGSYTSYLLSMVALPSSSVFERGPGGSFWEKKQEWLEHETSFNVDRVRTPALFTTHGHGVDPLRGDDAWIVQQTLGAFNRTGKPLEYLILQSGSHPVQRPHERLALSEAIVDWNVYWLQGYEDPDPRKAAQYARWRPKRAQQEQVLRSLAQQERTSRHEHTEMDGGSPSS